MSVLIIDPGYLAQQLKRKILTQSWKTSTSALRDQVITLLKDLVRTSL